MKFIILLLICIDFENCNGKFAGKNDSNNLSSISIDSIKKKKAIDSEMAKGDRPDNEQEGPSFKEVLHDYLDSYNKVKYIDKIVINGKDTFKLKVNFYCLHDSSLIIPKKYMWGGNKMDFITHNFASKILVVNNKDTILKKVFIKNDFNHVLNDQLIKYATLIDIGYQGYYKDKGEFALSYSISIPLTDVGVPAYLIIDKAGSYKVYDEYAKMDKYKKN